MYYTPEIAISIEFRNARRLTILSTFDKILEEKYKPDLSRYQIWCLWIFWSDNVGKINFTHNIATSLYTYTGEILWQR
jgi:hypothetical protein